MICTFFGHRDAPQNIQPVLCEILIQLIELKQVTTFYVGCQGNFDNLVKSVLKQLKKTYPHITYAVVLATLPQAKQEGKENVDTLFPEGLEIAPPRFAMDRRNRWLVEQADYVVTYVTRSFGGAAKFKALAEKKGKTVINIPDFS